MAIFEIDKGKARRVRLSEFKLEKDLQQLVENNLETIFNCRLIATEFSTGNMELQTFFGQRIKQHLIN
jgi:hypothetical protein